MNFISRAALALLAQPFVYAASQPTIPDVFERTCQHIKIYMKAFSTHNEIFAFVRSNPEFAFAATIAYRHAAELNEFRLGEESYRITDQTIQYWEQLVPWVRSLDPDVYPPVPEDPTNLIEYIQSESDLLQKVDEFCERIVNCLIRFWKDCPVDEVQVDIAALSLGIQNLKMAASQLPTNFGSVVSSGRSDQS